MNIFLASLDLHTAIQNIFTKKEKINSCAWLLPGMDLVPLNFGTGGRPFQGGGKWLVAAAVSLLFSCVAMQVYFGVFCSSQLVFS